MPTESKVFLKGFIIIFSLLFLSGLSAGQQGVAPAGPAGVQADVQSIDSLIRAFYESLTFAEGTAPDWERFRNLFASSAAPLVRTNPGAVLVTTLDGFLENFSGRIKSGALKSFIEEETFRTTQAFGDIAQVFSVYRKGMNTADPQKFGRGINSLQVFFKDGRWWIASLMWQDETPENPIPQKYLK
jgi:hypothetical protein